MAIKDLAEKIKRDYFIKLFYSYPSINALSDKDLKIITDPEQTGKT